MSSETVLGWRERIDLPQLGLYTVDAKIDTGARTSALDSENFQIFHKDKKEYLRFSVPSLLPETEQYVMAPLVGKRFVKNTSGVPQERYVIATDIALGPWCWQIEVTLARRKNMRHAMIIGRQAFDNIDLSVCPRRTYLLSSHSTRGKV